MAPVSPLLSTQLPSCPRSRKRHDLSQPRKVPQQSAISQRRLRSPHAWWGLDKRCIIVPLRA